MDAEDYLSQDEKQTKREIKDLLAQIQQLFIRFREEQDKFELNSHKKFTDIKRLIDIQREEIKAKIDEIALAMIKQIEDQEVEFKQKLTESRLSKDFKIEEEKESIEAEFRKLELSIAHNEQLRIKGRKRSKSSRFAVKNQRNRAHDYSNGSVFI